MKKFVLSIILYISTLSLAIAQEVKLTSSFDSTKILIGDQINYRIIIEKPAGLKLMLPVLKDTLCKKIDILSGPRTDSSSIGQGRIRIIQRYLVTSFDSGRYQVRPIFAEVKNSGGLKRYYSDYSVLDVMRARITPADTTSKIFDIIKPYKAPVTLADILPWFLLIVLAAAIAWLVFRYISKIRRSKVPESVYIPADPAHIIAFRELEQLRSEQLWQKGEIKKYYTRLTEILRQYLENRFRVFSLELTTDETLDALIKTGFKKDGSYNDLKTVLSGADLVKFAKYSPVPTENESHFQTSWNFILATKEQDIAPLQAENQLNEKEVKV